MGWTVALDRQSKERGGVQAADGVADDELTARVVDQPLAGSEVEVGLHALTGPDPTDAIHVVAESDLPDTADLALKANLGQIGVYTSELEERDLVRRRIHPTRDEQLGMRLQRRPSTTVTRPTGKGGIVLGPFVIQGVLERGRVGASDIVSGELRQGAMASFDLRLIRRLMRANVTRLNAQADQPQGQERGEGVGAAPHTAGSLSLWRTSGSVCHWLNAWRKMACASCHVSLR